MGLRGWEEGPADLPQRGYVEWKANAGKCNNDSEWKQDGRLGDEVHRRKGKGLTGIQVQF